MEEPTRILILEDDVADAELVQRELRKAGLDFTAVQARNKPEFLRALEAFAPNLLLADTRLPGLQEFRFTIILVSMLLSFMVILLAMYTTITERTREIGILKSLGASKSYIVQLILRESLLICGAGVVLGFVLAAVAIKLILTAFPSMPVNITTGWRVIAALMALSGGVLGALYPALKAAQLDPVKALGYE